MNPPSVYELTTPNSHSTNNTTKSVQSMVILTSVELWRAREEQRDGTADHPVRTGQRSTCHAMPRPRWLRFTAREFRGIYL
jgi:hypothetical protein